MGAVVLGLILLLVGLGLFLSQSGTVADCGTVFGQLGRAFSSEIAQRCSIANMLRIVGGLVAAGGIVLALVEVVQASKSGSHSP